MSILSEDQIAEYSAKGFVAVPGFLSREEIERLRRDFDDASRVSFRFYGVKDVTPDCAKAMKPRLLEVCRALAAGSETRADMLSGAVYWSSRKAKAGVTDAWHQDHDSWWLWGENHVDYLHMFIPIAKPDPDKTGLTLAALDRLAAAAPEAHRLTVGKGAMSLKRASGATTVLVRDTGKKHAFDFDVEAIAETPRLAEGDLLLFRGDVFHRTQDRECDRLAVSFRMARGGTPVRREHLLSWGCLEKFVLSMTNHEKYRYVLEALDRHGDGCPLGEVASHLEAAYDRPPRVSFAALLGQKLRAAASGLLGARGTGLARES